MIRWLGIERPLPPRVLVVARSMRKRFMKMGKNGSPPSIDNCCEDVSSAIADRLKKLGISCQLSIRNFVIVKKEICHWHCVVVFRRCILDATGDQFNGDLDAFNQPIRMRAIAFGTQRELDSRYSLT